MFSIVKILSSVSPTRAEYLIVVKASNKIKNFNKISIEKLKVDIFILLKLHNDEC